MRLAAGCLCAVLAVSPAAASTLWEQLPAFDDLGNNGIANQLLPDFGPDILAAVNDVTFATDVTVERVTTFNRSSYSGSTGSDVTTAVLNIFDGDPLTSADDPFSGGDFGRTAVPVDITAEPGGFHVVADGLGIPLAAGTYWFGLTPSLSFATSGQIFQHKSDIVGADARFRDTAALLGGTTDWVTVQEQVGLPGDTALRIEGTVTPVPLPPGMALLASGAGALAWAARRRRAARRG